MANLAYIQITRNCNQRCIICSNPPSGWKDLPLAQAKKLIDRYIREKYDGLILSGGEPTIYPYLPELIAYCRQKKFPMRLISNGQKMADAKYVRLLIAAGLKHVEVSLYSSRKDIQARLTGNPDSLDKVKTALANLAKTKIRIDICITINKLNADHLNETVKFILKEYPAIPHFIFNNLDTRNDRVKANPQTISHLADFEAELVDALKVLEKNKKSFRAEHVPLCYLPEFEHCSTETRKIVKREIRPIYFLDNRGFDFQKTFRHEKDKRCKICFLNGICAGFFQSERRLNRGGLYPVFVTKEEIERRIFALEIKYNQSRRQRMIYSLEFKKILEDKKKIKRILSQNNFGNNFRAWEKMRSPFAKAINKSGTILDIGCANGFLLRSLQEWTAYNLIPYGIDVNKKLIIEARKIFKREKNNFRTLDFKELPAIKKFGFPDRFNYIYFNIGNNWIFSREQIRYLYYIFNFLKKRGRLILAFYDKNKNRNIKKIKKLKKFGLLADGSLESSEIHEHEIIVWIEKK